MWLLFRRFPNVWGLFVTLCVQILIIGAWSYLSHHWYFRTFPAKKTVIIWEELQGMESLVKDYGMEQHFNIIRSMPVGECMKDEKMSKFVKECGGGIPLQHSFSRTKSDCKILCSGEYRSILCP